MSDPRTAEERFQDWLDTEADWVGATPGNLREWWKQQHAASPIGILKKHGFEFEVFAEEFWRTRTGRAILWLAGGARSSSRPEADE